MDDAKLKAILESMEIPPVDENARKRALNLAVAEFKDLEDKRKNAPQGFGSLFRLMGMTTRTRSNPMEQISKRRLMYGGMATAMAVVLIAGVTFSQLQTFNRVTAQSGGKLNPVTFTAQNAAPAEQSAAEHAYVRSDKDLGTLQNGESDLKAKVADAPLAAPTAPPAGAAINQRVMAFQEMKKEQVAPAMRTMNAQKQIMTVGSGGVRRDTFSEPTEPMPRPGYHDVGRDKFRNFDVSPVKQVSAEPVSTFSIDVDTSSYSFVRSQLNSGLLPQKDAVRVEEMINYFDYNYPLPESKTEPFKPSIAVTNSPWSKDKKLVRIGIKGYDIAKNAMPHSNLVFLLDTSGSMNEPNKLPLVKNSMKLLLDTLKPDDTISIVAYAGSAGTVLDPTKVSDKSKILSAIDNLAPDGGTAGAEGINLAYQLAEQNFDKEGVNRVILATDGDFNVGITSEEELKSFIERKRDTGIFLSVLGFGEGNLNDSLMQTLAQNGNGVAAYIDTLNEARKVLVKEASSTLFPIAKDVKIQVEFNPAQVSEYRLIGYETRALKNEDFNNDKVDAGDIGAGHAVTAIYEITPAGATPSIDPSRYAKPQVVSKIEDAANFSNELGFLKIRYKLPEENTSKLISTPITMADQESLTPGNCPPMAKCKMMAHSDDTGWAVAVAGFAQLLKGDPNVSGLTYDDVIDLAQANKGDDPFGYRAEFINLVRLAKSSAASVAPQ